MSLQFLKGLLITLVGVFVTYFTSPAFMWSMLLITLIGVSLVYIGKNAFVGLQSISPPGTLDLRNILSALLIAIGTAVTEAIATIAGTGIINWIILGKVVLAVTFTYLGTTVFAGPYNPAPIVKLSLISTTPRKIKLVDKTIKK